MPRLPKRYYWDKHINLQLKYFYVFVTIGTGTFVMTHRKAWEQQMIYLMMIDAEEDKQKFAILYETYRHLMMKVALNVLKDTFLAEDAVHESFIKIAKNMEK